MIAGLGLTLVSLIYHRSSHDFKGRFRVFKAGTERMDDADKGLLQSILPPLAILVLTTIIFLRFNSSGVILAGSLGVAFFVIADVIWSLRTPRPPTR